MNKDLQWKYIYNFDLENYIYNFDVYDCYDENCLIAISQDFPSLIIYFRDEEELKNTISEFIKEFI